MEELLNKIQADAGNAATRKQFGEYAAAVRLSPSLVDAVLARLSDSLNALCVAYAQLLYVPR